MKFLLALLPLLATNFVCAEGLNISDSLKYKAIPYYGQPGAYCSRVDAQGMAYGSPVADEFCHHSYRATAYYGQPGTYCSHVDAFGVAYGRSVKRELCNH